MEQVADLPVDDFLKKWFNHHLKEANHPDELKKEKVWDYSVF